MVGSPHRQCAEGLVYCSEGVFHSVWGRVCRIVPQSTDALKWSPYGARGQGGKGQYGRAGTVHGGLIGEHGGRLCIDLSARSESVACLHKA